jgi:hypothetical protein
MDSEIIRAMAQDYSIGKLTSILNTLVKLGFLEAQVLEDGAYGYSITDKGSEYYQLAPASDPIVLLMTKIIDKAIL